jgi:hypothetical protein
VSGQARREGAHVTVSDLTRFLLSRLDQDERDAHLFHEFTCTADEQHAGDGFPGSWCRCPVPAQTLTRGQATRDIIARCEQQLRQPVTPGMLSPADAIPKILGAIALPYELDPRWQEQWRP